MQIKNVPIADQECAKQAEPELGGIDTCTKAELVQQLSALVSQREALAFSEEELEASLHQLGSSSEKFIMCGEASTRSI